MFTGTMPRLRELEMRYDGDFSDIESRTLVLPDDFDPSTFALKKLILKKWIVSGTVPQYAIVEL